ncbi:MAG: 3-deoxy-D-manno-octulosonic acid transferase [Cytophagales bacterium]|nr:3-deoxy-D-manno-octulosonic acid transferase [Cytophagales bacterium]
MKKILYDIALGSLPVLLRLSSPFYPKAKLMTRGRRNWQKKLSAKEFTGKKVWIHCASLGEFEQGRPLIESVKKNYPHHSVIVTFFSSSGYEIQKDYKLADLVCYLPFDGAKSSRLFIDILDPDVAIFVKYEFWYYYLKELKSRKTPTFSVSSIFRPEQHFFKKNGKFFREMLLCFDHFFVQNENSKALLSDLDLENVTVSGDTRFDRVAQICSEPKRIELVEKFKGSSKVLVIGSSWPEDMEVLYPVIHKERVGLKFVIAPHEIEPAKIKNLCRGLKVRYQLFSSMESNTISEAKVLIIDNIGLLSSLYQYGEMAYIGGAFGEGLHSVLEAATFGIPVFFGKGKDNHKYQEAADLVKRGGAFEINHVGELEANIVQLLSNEKRINEVSEISKDYVNSKVGATDKIMNHLKRYLS